MLLGIRLKALREEKGLTQEKLANMINVTKSTISYYENDERVPTVSNLCELVKVFNVSFDYLMGNDQFEIAEGSETENYGMYMAKEELEFIKEIRHYSDFHSEVIKHPKRCAERINKKLFK